MKPSELKPLVGRKVIVYWNGTRSGVVKRVVSTDVLSVQLLHPHGRRRIELKDVWAVMWYGKERKVEEFLALAAKGEAK